jgi:hypothetical protein
MTTVVAVVPLTDGAVVKDIELPADDVERLHLLQDTVGGYLELVASRIPGLWLFCNEDGHRLGMLPNVVATVVTGQHIVGPVVCHGGADDHGDLLPCPERYRQILLAAPGVRLD